MTTERWIDTADSPWLAPTFALLCEGIPDPAERDSAAEVAAMAASARYRVLAITEGPDVVAMGICQVMPKARIAFVIYAVVTASHRGQGLGRRVIELLEVKAREAYPEIDLTLAETNAPDRAHLIPVDGMPVRDRLARFHRLGFVAVEFDYVQPPGDDTLPPVGYLMLIARTIGGPPPESVQAKRIADALAAYLTWVDDLQTATGRLLREAMLHRLAEVEACSTHALVESA